MTAQQAEIRQMNISKSRINVIKGDFMGITKQGLAASTALLGACFAGMLALLSLEALDGSRIYAMIGFSAALPLLSFSISVEMLQPLKGQRSTYNLAIMLMGASSGIIGLFFSIYHLSIIAATIFGFCCMLTVTLSWFANKT